jgi:3',5'-cyclic AMP phosphodiesterase CpdA
VRGPLAIVGLNSALPTAPFVASGALGPEQLERLEKLLAELARGEHFRLLLIHHPPLRGELSRRRSLDDAEALSAVLARTGVDLVVHGHLHRTRIGSMPGPLGPIPVVGVRSASDQGSKPGKRASYHLFRLHEQAREGDRPRYRIELCTRAFGDDGFSESSVRSL